jgi:hypothetical protein
VKQWLTITKQSSKANGMPVEFWMIASGCCKMKQWKLTQPVAEATYAGLKRPSFAPVSLRRVSFLDLPW